MAVQRSSSPACLRPLRLALLVACLAAPLAWSQAESPPSASPTACSLQPRYPLPAERSALQKLADAQQAAAAERGCLTSAAFHAWRGATLLALGRSAEAIEPLERALLHDPDLPGAQLDLAQALAAEGDTASARSFLTAMRQRADLPLPIGSAIDRQMELLSVPERVAGALTTGWQSRWQFSALGGADSNLNNAPSASEITLTLPGQGNVTLPLDVASQARGGGAALGVVQWQGLRVKGDSLWVLQAELRRRQTAERATTYQQSDVAATWLQAPAAPRQWMARLATGHLQYGGSSLLHATRATLQHQWEARGRNGLADRWVDHLAGCRPAGTLELEHRRYPSTPGLDGVYQGVGLGWLCRRSGTIEAGAAAADLTANTSFYYGVQVRLGRDRPLRDGRPGGGYRRAEIRAQWEGPLLAKGRIGAQWTATRQIDGQAYSILLGNVARNTLRHVFQLEASWPIARNLSLVGNAEAARQSSNLAAFEARQRSLYVGLRWDLMQ